MRRFLSSAAATTSVRGGTLYAWGSGELGVEFAKSLTNTTNKSFVPIVVDPQTTSEITSIAAGHTHSLFSTEEGKVFAFGNNSFGCLGHAPFSPTKADDRVAIPTPVQGVESIHQVACGHGYSAALNTRGELFTWGFHQSFVYGVGALGRQANDEQDFTPGKVFVGGEENDIRLKAISCGAQHMMGLGLDGEVWSWGKGANGMQGNGDSIDQPFPQPVSYFVDTNVVVKQIASGADFNLAVDVQGKVYSWGANTRGQLGLGGGFSMDLENMPRMIDFFEKEGIAITQISAGNCHACAVTDKGEVYTWGYSAWTEPHLVSKHTLLEGKRVIKTSSGKNFSAAITDSGEVYTWGKNYFVQRLGCLGTGTDHPYSKRQPELVKDICVRDVSCGDTHVLAVGGLPLI
ncbi:hypothetical protein BASA81_014006 [Batrachochytrium salamandrivorans]|nr:hypothetical protein BASA81_014006 [Batrachochytrium salamandrivorans]